MKAVVYVLAAAAVVEAAFFDKYPAAREVLPADIASFIEGLTPAEYAAIKAANARHPGNIKAFIKDVEHTNPALAIKSTPLAKKYQRIVKSLTPAGRRYADDLLKQLSLTAVNPSDSKVRSVAADLYNKYVKLDKVTQDQLNAKFPKALSGLKKLSAEGPGAFKAASPPSQKPFYRNPPNALPKKPLPAATNSLPVPVKQG